MNKKKIRDKEANLEKEMILNPENIEKRKRDQRKRILTAVGIGFIIFIGVILISFQMVKAIGKANLQGKSITDAPELLTEEMESAMEEQQWQEGWVRYKDTTYAYNNDVMTFLVMGIDKNDDVEEVAGGTNGGQADALFLLVLNPHDKSIKVIGINRNTMTDVNLYTEDGAYMTTVTAQIAVQHGFGNGMEESCEYQLDAVKKLFYNLPIHGYCAINMSAVIPLTDMIGGIELTALEDVKSSFKEEMGAYVVKSGETILLDGRSGYSYVRYRDINIAGSSDMRLKRQKQYLEKIIGSIKAETKKDISLPIKIYNAVESQMVTNITVDEVTYLVSTAIDYKFDSKQFYFLKGETVQGERFEEYYIDEDALYEMILHIFYEPV